jgi:S1-C subfamily serine protease
MDLLDLVIIVLCIGFGISGWRQGFLIGVLSFVGFLGGGALGAKYAGSLHSSLKLGIDPPLFGLLVVVVFAIVGQLIATLIGIALRREFRWRPLRAADSAAGGAVSVLSVLLVVWLVCSALAHTSASGLSREINRSSILRGISSAMPSSANTWFSSFRRLLDKDGLPEVFGGIGSEHVEPAAPPDPALVHSRAVRVARAEVVKVTGVANSCSRRLEGSGFVFAADRVMTNAHVVAGVGSPNVSTQDGRTLSAKVVLYDPERDVAVLLVPGLNLSPLSFGGALARGEQGVVVGYPEDGPFTPRAARVRTVENARGPDIYQNREVTRQIYSLYTRVQPGNSGGPLLNLRGGVAGVVFAAAVDNPHTGYALTAQEVAPDASAGARAIQQVSTGGCD